ncbi:DUF645 family protein [Vibrio cholerae]|nr:DUF645 family protein [Vibrio cholerae]MDP4497750.1 DUF645 family protein [Vibrio cholerae]WLP78983.1 DUF645 family protein [Vibrio cholerae]
MDVQLGQLGFTKSSIVAEIALSLAEIR